MQDIDLAVRNLLIRALLVYYVAMCHKFLGVKFLGVKFTDLKIYLIKTLVCFKLYIKPLTGISSFFSHGFQLLFFSINIFIRGGKVIEEAKFHLLINAVIVDVRNRVCC